MFGPFQLSLVERSLTAGGQKVPLGSRAFEILVVLTDTPGSVVAQNDLLARVWPGMHIDPGALRVHIAGLRKALAAFSDESAYIVNVAGRGYRFAGPVELPDSAVPNMALAPELPAIQTRIIGREADIDELVATLTDKRFLTVVGPGGIGKTTVSLAIASRLAERYRDGVRFVDFTPHFEAHLVPSVTAAAISGSVSDAHTVEQLSAGLRSQEMMIVLDNCEHLITAIAPLAERLHASAPGLHILSTSREPLRAAGEWVHRLPPLALPERSANLDPAVVFATPAVRLLVERARAASSQLVFGSEDAADLAHICHRVDGIPLAIELAAARLELLGARGVAARLEDSFALLTTGRRTALPRHQTLNATLDWSYQLLPEIERTLLCQLAIFRSSFTAEAASAVVSDFIAGGTDVIEAIGGLHAKSLLVVDETAPVRRFRLLETTRIYAAERLVASPDYAAVARRHALLFAREFARLESLEPTISNKLVRTDNIGKHLEDVRAALEWAFRDTGDEAVGIALTISAKPLWRYLMLADVSSFQHDHFHRLLPQGGASLVRSGIGLYAGLASRLLLWRETTAKLKGAWQAAFAIADDMTETEARFWTQWGGWLECYLASDWRAALRYAKQGRDLVCEADLPLETACANFITAVAEFVLGNFADAREHLEYALNFSETPVKPAVLVRFQWNPFVAMRCYHAEVLWHVGALDHALALAMTNIEIARRLDHPVSMWNALAHGGCAVAIRWGDMRLASHLVKSLLDVSQFNPPWSALARCYDGWLWVQRGHHDKGIATLREALAELEPRAFGHRYVGFVGILADSLSLSDHRDEAIATITEALDRSQRNEVLWCLPELLRIRGDIAWRERDGPTAEAHFSAALDLAREQGAWAAVLRTVTSLAGMHLDQGRAAEALQLITPVLARFEDNEAADLRNARSLKAKINEAVAR